MKKETIHKRLVRYTFVHQKITGGSDHIGDSDFIMPNADGIEEGKLIKSLPESHKISVVIEVKED